MSNSATCHPRVEAAAKPLLDALAAAGIELTSIDRSKSGEQLILRLNFPYGGVGTDFYLTKKGASIQHATSHGGSISYLRKPYNTVEAMLAQYVAAARRNATAAVSK